MPICNIEGARKPFFYNQLVLCLRNSYTHYGNYWFGNSLKSSLFIGSTFPMNERVVYFIYGVKIVAQLCDLKEVLIHVTTIS